MAWVYGIFRGCIDGWLNWAMFSLDDGSFFSGRFEPSLPVLIMGVFSAAAGDDRSDTVRSRREVHVDRCWGDIPPASCGCLFHGFP